jgi:hypothetical protein
MVEGFVIHFYNQKKGHVLKSCRCEDGTEGFYTDIKEALEVLDKIRYDWGFPPREQSLRLNIKK